MKLRSRTIVIPILITILRTSNAAQVEVKEPYYKDQANVPVSKKQNTPSYLIMPSSFHTSHSEKNNVDELPESYSITKIKSESQEACRIMLQYGSGKNLRCSIHSPSSIDSILQPHNSQQTVRSYLTLKFPLRDVIYEKDLVYMYDTITKIETPLLTKLINATIFRTELTSGYNEYRKVEIAVILCSNGNIEILQSPLFTTANDRFLDLVRGTCVKKAHEKIVITEEIANVFKELTYQGSITNITTVEYGVSCNLMHGDLWWRKLDFTFSENCLDSIKVINPTTIK